MRKLLILLLLLAAGTVGARMYKWVDDDGVTQYTQTPPPDRQATTVKPPPPPAQSPDEARRQLRDEVTEKVDDYLEDQDLAAKEREQEQKEQAVYEKNCQAARNNIANLQNLANRSMRMPDGSYVALDEKKRSEMLEEARGLIKKYCK